MAGGFRFANIFRCLSISSLCEFILSCCLEFKRCYTEEKGKNIFNMAYKHKYLYHLHI